MRSSFKSKVLVNRALPPFFHNKIKPFSSLDTHSSLQPHHCGASAAWCSGDFFFWVTEGVPHLHPVGCLPALSPCCRAATLRVGSPSLPAADPAPKLRAAFELEEVGSDSTMPRPTRCRACGVTCQVLEGASLPPPTSREHLESEPVWKKGQANIECSQMTPNMVLFLSTIFPLQTPTFQAHLHRLVYLALSKGGSVCSWEDGLYCSALLWLRVSPSWTLLDPHLLQDLQIRIDTGMFFRS